MKTFLYDFEITDSTLVRKMVCTSMSDDDAILSAMTDIKFVKSLIRALA